MATTNLKILFLLVLFFSTKSNNIQSFLYKEPVLSGDYINHNISKLILDCAIEKNIPLENCLSVSADFCSSSGWEK